jgi:hypothetical protein
VRALLGAARLIEAADIPVVDLGVRRPSLDDVFLTLTGATEPAPSGTALRAVAAPELLAPAEPRSQGARL